MTCDARARGGGEELCASRTDPLLLMALVAGLLTMKESPVLFSVFRSHDCRSTLRHHASLVFFLPVVAGSVRCALCQQDTF